MCVMFCILSERWNKRLVLFPLLSDEQRNNTTNLNMTLVKVSYHQLSVSTFVHHDSVPRDVSSAHVKDYSFYFLVVFLLLDFSSS